MRNNGSWTVLRWGLAFVFFYAAIASVAYPERWVTYVPGFVTSIVTARTFLVLFSLYELILAGFLFAGIKVKWSSFFAMVTFLVILLVNFHAMSVVFTDVGLAFASLALFEAERDVKRNKNTLHGLSQ
jgi:hypothetical protein